MRAMLEDGDPRILQVLAAPGPLGIVIDHAGDADGALRTFVRPVARRDGRAHGTRLEQLSCAEECGPAGCARSIRDAGPDQVVQRDPGQTSAALAIDGDLTTTWWTDDETTQSAEVTIELDSPTRVGQVVMALGGVMTDFPKRLQIDVSADGVAWETAWTGSPALNAYYGAVRHPREIPSYSR